MKNKFFILLMVTVLLTSAGCGKDEGDLRQLIEAEPIKGESIEAEPIEESVKKDHKDQAVENSDSEEVDDGSLDEQVKENSSAVKNEEEKAAYYALLQSLYQTYTLPDGTELGYDEITDLSWNQFAIYDIDQDGKEELLILWTTTYTAGMSGIVYGLSLIHI